MAWRIIRIIFKNRLQHTQIDSVWQYNEYLALSIDNKLLESSNQKRSGFQKWKSGKGVLKEEAGEGRNKIRFKGNVGFFNK